LPEIPPSLTLRLRIDIGMGIAEVPEHSVNPCLVVGARNAALGGEPAAQDTERRIFPGITEAEIGHCFVLSHCELEGAHSYRSWSRGLSLAERGSAVR
jgi:hypothetical protein